MIINRRNQSGASSPATAVTDADAAVMNAAIVAALRRRNTPPGNFLKTNEENTAFSPANVAAKNINSSIQGGAAQMSIPQFRGPTTVMEGWPKNPWATKPLQLTQRERELNNLSGSTEVGPGE